MSEITIEKAEPADDPVVSSILQEAAAWIEELGAPLWKKDEIDVEAVQGEVAAGLYWIARVDGEVAGCVRYQLEDPLFWPDATLGEAAYLHRLAIRRAYGGGEVSSALIDWAKTHARDRGHLYLRLDCDVGRPRLRAFYERHGFNAVGEREVGLYTVALYECDLTAARDAG